MTRNKKIFIAIIVAIAFLFILVLIRGYEDTWICVDGEWVKHGVPSAPMPTEPCGEKPQAEKSVKLFYYNPEKDMGDDGNTLCSRKGLLSVERKISITKTPIQDTIKLLLKGELSQSERDTGITTEYPLQGLLLKGTLLKDGVLTLEFDDPNNKTVGGSCRV
ncbi:MAG: hypothetical protein NT078_01065, partial [Candidatus Azambacteria bacterium]|nr:hypothetical protein [Candidatus Azambacteria bacterium]